MVSKEETGPVRFRLLFKLPFASVSASVGLLWRSPGAFKTGPHWHSRSRACAVGWLVLLKYILPPSHSVMSSVAEHPAKHRAMCEAVVQLPAGAVHRFFLPGIYRAGT